MTDQERPPKVRNALVYQRPKFVRRDGWISAGDAFDSARKVLRSESRAEEELLAAMLDGSLKATTRCILDDYDVHPVPEKPPLKKGSLMRGILFSSEGQACGLLNLGLRREAKEGKLVLDVHRSMLIVVHPPDGVVYQDEEDGRVTIRPQTRRVYYKLEVEEDSLRELLESHKRKKAPPAPQGELDPDTDTYRVKLTSSQWKDILSPLIELSRAGRLGDRFGVLERGDKRVIADEILRLLEASGHRASPTTLNRKANELITMDEHARKAQAGSPDGST